MVKTNLQLPYFDALIEQFRLGNAEAIAAFGRHVHWGYWENPAQADGTVEDFADAAERLCQRVCDSGGVGDRQRILDCGCGWGGTIASLNDRFSPVQLVGLNIDDRQLERAREQVQPRDGNAIEFIQGDACQLPFADASFDVVLAVECIFHFPSRERFFQEARRVLRTGGRLAICDFVPLAAVLPAMRLLDNFVKPSVASTYGYVDSSYSLANYRTLAQDTGFVSAIAEDITINTLPTYPVVRRLARQLGATDVEKVTAGGELMSRLGLTRYIILSFEAR